MHPWLLHHPPVPTYGILLLLAVIASWLLARVLARRTMGDARLRLPPSHLDLLLPVLVGAGLLGAWLFGKLTGIAAGDAANAVVSGNVLLGALLTSTAAGIIYALVAAIPLGLLGDVLSPAVPLGIAIGRVGCFMAGCCFGKTCAHPTALTAVVFPQFSPAYNQQLVAGLLRSDAAASRPVHPVQLYEALLCLVLAVVLVAGFNHRRNSGELFLSMALGYAVLRFSLEFLRADNPSVAFGLTFSQLLCASIFGIALITLILRRRWADRLSLRLRHQ